MKFKGIFIILFLMANTLTTGAVEKIILSETVYEGELLCLEIQKIETEEGVWFWRVVGFLAGEAISWLASSMAEGACNAVGGHSSTCSFVGEAAGMLSGMRRIGRTKSYNRTKSYASPRNYNKSSVSARTKYDARRDRGEVEYQSTSKEAINQVANSMVSHYFSGLMGNIGSISTPRPNETYNYRQPTYPQQQPYSRYTWQELLCLQELESLAIDYKLAVFLGETRKANRILKKYNRKKEKCF